MMVRTHNLGAAGWALAHWCLCASLLLPSMLPAPLIGGSEGKGTLQAVQPLGLLDFFYTESSSREEAPEREAENSVELEVGITHSRQTRDLKRVRPLPLRTVQAMIANHRHLHAQAPISEHALRHGNALAAHCRC